MARSYGKVFASRWGDGDWRALSFGAQWLYDTLISQSRLTLAGSLDLMPTRWAQLATGTTVADVERFLAELEAERFVAVDRSTEEVVIRTLVRHDLDNHRLNKNLISGLWTSWAGIMSETLRKVVVDNLPEIIWEKSGPKAPEAALQMRRSPRLELPVPTSSPDQPSQPPVDTTSPNDPIEPPSPSPSRVSVSGRASPSLSSTREPRELSSIHTQPDPVDNPDGKPSEPHDDTGTNRDNPGASIAEQAPDQDELPDSLKRLVDAALAVLVDRDLDARQQNALLTPIGDPVAWRRKATAHRIERGTPAALIDLARLDPQAGPQQLADALEPTRSAAIRDRHDHRLDGQQDAMRQRERDGMAANADVVAEPLPADGLGLVARARQRLSADPKPPDPDQRAADALTVLVDRDLDARQAKAPLSNPDAWRRKTTRHRTAVGAPDALAELARAHPDADARTLADLYEPPGGPR